MEILKTVLLILFAIDCIALTVIVLMQEGKSAGLGTIAGMADSYCTCSSPEPESFCITND